MRKKVLKTSLGSTASLRTRARWALSRIKREGYQIAQRLQGYSKHQRELDFDQILIGDQCGSSLEKWIQKTGEFDRISVSLKDSPYVRFLQDVDRDESLLEDSGFLESHPYFRMAETALRFSGSYFEVTTREGIFSQMRRFYDLFKTFDESASPNFVDDYRHSPPGASITVYAIASSDCYEIRDGHHRAAARFVRGEKSLNVEVIGRKQTCLQQIVLRGLQTTGRHLYQPVQRKEVSSWPVLRQCSDRMQLMKDFLASDPSRGEPGTMIDLACCYGWFVSEFKKEGFKALGVDRDENALLVGKVVYGLKDDDLLAGELLDVLDRSEGSHDVVLFLSILHHFASGKEHGDVDAILKKLDGLTKHVLFLDSGQCHEEWFHKKLVGWDDDFIEQRILKSTSFQKVIRLGKDRDNRGDYKDQYARTLFACVK